MLRILHLVLNITHLIIGAAIIMYSENLAKKRSFSAEKVDFLEFLQYTTKSPQKRYPILDSNK